MILLVRLLVAFGIGLVGSWIVYAFFRDGISGNGYLYIALGISVVGFFWFGGSQWYERFRRDAWQRRIDRMNRP